MPTSKLLQNFFGLQDENDETLFNACVVLQAKLYDEFLAEITQFDHAGDQKSFGGIARDDLALTFVRYFHSKLEGYSIASLQHLLDEINQLADAPERGGYSTVEPLPSEAEQTLDTETLYYSNYQKDDKELAITLLDQNSKTHTFSIDITSLRPTEYPLYQEKPSPNQPAGYYFKNDALYFKSSYDYHTEIAPVSNEQKTYLIKNNKTLSTASLTHLMTRKDPYSDPPLELNKGQPPDDKDDDNMEKYANHCEQVKRVHQKIQTAATQQGFHNHGYRANAYVSVKEALRQAAKEQRDDKAVRVLRQLSDELKKYVDRKKTTDPDRYVSLPDDNVIIGGILWDRLTAFHTIIEYHLNDLMSNNDTKLKACHDTVTMFQAVLNEPTGKLSKILKQIQEILDSCTDKFKGKIWLNKWDTFKKKIELEMDNTAENSTDNTSRETTFEAGHVAGHVAGDVAGHVAGDVAGHVAGDDSKCDEKEKHRFNRK